MLYSDIQHENVLTNTCLKMPSTIKVHIKIHFILDRKHYAFLTITCINTILLTVRFMNKSEVLGEHF